MYLKDEILRWAEDKGIIAHGNPFAQSRKTLEETVELVNAVHEADYEEVIDAVGDIYVTLIIQCEMQGIDMESCINSAYNVISKRTGRMENGMFIKEETA